MAKSKVTQKQSDNIWCLRTKLVAAAPAIARLLGDFVLGFVSVPAHPTQGADVR